MGLERVTMTDPCLADVCPIADRCGGCRFQGVAYARQLAEKEAAVREALVKNELDASLLSGIEASPAIFAYRNKMDYTFGDEVKDGPLELGMHKKGQFMSIVSSGCCRLVPADFDRILDATLAFCRDRGYTHYHKRRHEGLLRFLVVRRGVRTGELLVNLVTSSQGSFDEQGWLALLKSLPLEDRLVGVLHTLDDSPADAVVPDETRLLWGRDWYGEEILGLRFRVGAFSFFQTNVAAAERLYLDAVELAGGMEGKTVYDLYCGTGTITQALARSAKKVIGVEIVEEAVLGARRAAADNGLSNCEFIAGDVLKVLDGIEELPDAIVVDPPRAGIHPKAMEKICGYGVPQIVYVSCNPKTMAAGAKQAEAFGYRMTRLRAYDNFPFTSHVEALALLTLQGERSVAG